MQNTIVVSLKVHPPQLFDDCAGAQKRKFYRIRPHQTIRISHVKDCTCLLGILVNCAIIREKRQRKLFATRTDNDLKHVVVCPIYSQHFRFVQLFEVFSVSPRVRRFEERSPYHIFLEGTLIEDTERGINILRGGYVSETAFSAKKPLCLTYTNNLLCQKSHLQPQDIPPPYLCQACEEVGHPADLRV